MEFDLNILIDEFLNPPKEPFLKRVFKTQEAVKNDLLEKTKKRQAIQDLTKTYGWREIIRPKIVNSLRQGFGKLLRDGLTMSEIDIKNILAEMRTSLSIIAEMRYLVNEGDISAEKLSFMEKKIAP